MSSAAIVIGALRVKNKNNNIEISFKSREHIQKKWHVPYLIPIYMFSI